MLERFASRFQSDSGASIAGGCESSVTALRSHVGGHSFNGGLYRVHTAESAAVSDREVAAAFPEYVGRIGCFAFDWAGNQFSLDFARGSSDDPEILMYDIGGGEVFQVPSTFSQFHDVALHDNREEDLAEEYFGQWIAAGGRAPAWSECVGYRRPLFLGGVDALENMEITDTSVYWSTMGQLRAQTRNR